MRRLSRSLSFESLEVRKVLSADAFHSLSHVHNEAPTHSEESTAAHDRENGEDRESDSKENDNRHGERRQEQKDASSDRKARSAEKRDSDNKEKEETDDSGTDTVSDLNDDRNGTVSVDQDPKQSSAVTTTSISDSVVTAATKMAEDETSEGKNDSKSTAQRLNLAVGESIELTGTIGKSNRDFFVFRANQDGQLSVKSASVAGVAPTVEMEDHQGRDVLELEPNDGHDAGIARVTAGRSYFIRLRGTNNQVSDYQVTLKLNSAVDSNGAVEVPIAEIPAAMKANALDTNGDDSVSPSDALMIVNVLNRLGGSELVDEVLQLVCDLNGDDSVSPLDALTLINYLNLPPAESLVSQPTIATNDPHLGNLGESGGVMFVDQIFMQMGMDDSQVES